MSKQIQLPDEVYKKLREPADKNYRTLGGQLEYLLDKEIDDEL
jgi:hypothetical protein